MMGTVRHKGTTPNIFGLICFSDFRGEVQQNMPKLHNCHKSDESQQGSY